jgi:protein TonB
VGWGWYGGKRAVIGNQNNEPGPGEVTLVNTIPMPYRRAEANPVANETESRAPAQTKPQAQEKEEPDAIALEKARKKVKEKKKKAVVSVPYRPPRDYDPNQLYSSHGARMSTQMFHLKGGGGVGFGEGSPFGLRLGWYADLIRQRIGEKWHTQDVDAHLNTAPVVTVMFDIQRDGRVTGARIIQRSGNYALDNSALRAVQEASPLPPLPPEFERRSANVEFNFQFQR